MKLSILIPTLPDRAYLLKRLMNILNPQVTNEVDILIDDRDRLIPTGRKRNELIQRASGEYFCFVDDDDMVRPFYISELLKAIESSPDVVTFCGWMTTNGMNRVDWVIKLGENYEARKDQDGVTRYYRFPNHLCPMKRSKVADIKFQEIYLGEDYAWAYEINKRDRLKTSVHIPLQLYHYDYKTLK